MGLHKLSAGIYGPNVASLRAFERAGFRVEAVLHGHASHNGNYIDVIQLARFADSDALPANPRPSFLPYGRHLIEDDDVAAVANVLRGDWLTTGPGC